jgi:hypothetical protein
MSQIFKRFYAEAGIDTTGRNISNHSGHVTCCTRLYNEGIKENLNFHVHFCITFYGHNFPYVVRHLNFRNSFGFAHTCFIFNARFALNITCTRTCIFGFHDLRRWSAQSITDVTQHFNLFPLISLICIAAMITTAYHGFVSESLVIKAGATCNMPRMIRDISPRSINGTAQKLCRWTIWNRIWPWKQQKVCPIYPESDTKCSGWIEAPTGRN